MTDERVALWLEDLRGFGADAAYLVSIGRQEYLADSEHGRMLRNAAERLLIKVATVAERLPQPYKSEHQDVDWVAITRMRNLVAHHYDKVNDDLMWVTLERTIPELLRRLHLALGD